jgi:hypothetical protein
MVRPMTEEEMLRTLAGVPEGATLFVSYLAGRAPTATAIREAERARREGMAKRHFFGTLTGVRMTKKGDSVLTVQCDNRDDERRGTEDGYRTFNPNLGKLLAVEVVVMTPAKG